MLIQRSGEWLDVEDSGDLVKRLDRFLEDMTDFHFDQHEVQSDSFHGGAVSDAGFTADFLIQGLHGTLVPIHHEHGPDRNRFLVPTRELARRVLVAST